jgi:U3 small nucleolar ribonucleoprotein protein LCP5
MREYEEENFTRVALSKKDERRRRRDEEDLALGGGRGSRGRSGQSAGFEAELGGLLGRFGDEDGGAGGRKRGRKRDSSGAQGDSYEALRRSKAPRPSLSAGSSSAAGSGSGKRSRPQGGQFEKGLKRVQKKMKR